MGRETMMRILGDRVLVALEPPTHEQEATTGFSYKPQETRESGIILAARADAYDPERSTRGIVMQVGEKRGQVDLDDVRAEVNEVFIGAMFSETLLPHEIKEAVDRALMRMAPAPFDVQVGDMVIFAIASGSSFTHDGVSYVILSESEILGVLDPHSKEAA
jgi:co-chaperonin GroES (HSP10)